MTRAIWVSGIALCGWGGVLCAENNNNLVTGPAVVDPASRTLWRPMTTDERIEWYIDRTAGRGSFIRGVALSGFSTLRDSPSGWDRTGQGFSQRMGHRFARVTISNSVQLGMGFLLKDDPRYHRAPDKGAGGRLWNAAISAVTARDSTGNRMPAYSRFAGVAVSNIAAKSWLPPGRDTWSDVAISTGTQIGGQMGLNVLREFWPDIKRKFKK